MTAALQDPPETAAATARAAVRLLRERLWGRALLLVVVLSVLCLLLGRWQWHRHLAKVARTDRIEANYATAPVPLAQMLPTPDTPLPAEAQWRQVRVRGIYQVDRTVLVRNRPLDGEYGYEVLVPLRTSSGALLLVDRGWIPNGRTGARPDSVPNPSAGTVEVVARLRPGEPHLDRTPPPGQALRIDLPQIATTVSGPTYQAYGVLASESPQPPTNPRPLPEPTLDLGPHLAYALQWWGFAVTGYVLLGYYARREVLTRAALAAGVPPEELRRRRSRRHEDEDEEL